MAPPGSLYSRSLAVIVSRTLTSLTLAGPTQDSVTYADGIAKINEMHAKAGRSTETQLAHQLSPNARGALKRVLEAKAGPDLGPALLRCGEAALNLDLLNDFEAVRTRLLTVAPDLAAKLGRAVSRQRFIVRGVGEFREGYLDEFGDVFEGILGAYDEVFGFKEFSKIPGKKLRVRVHLEPAITNPPHFAPEFPWHSEIDFPVVDAAQFSSPTQKGQFLFYGLCHELGHVVAMWGDLQMMEDHHSWAHYTGVTIVEHLAQSAKEKPWMQNVRDVRWRSLTLERALPANRTNPSLKDAAGVMSLLISLHDTMGPKAIGAALNRMDEQRKNSRINHVRYYRFAELRQALEEITPEAEKRAAVAKIFGKPS